MKAPTIDRLWNFLLGACSCVFLSLPAGADEVHFRVPEGLDTAVAFWERVFSDYTPDECIFHDKEDLSIIYGSKYIPKDSPTVARRLIKKYVVDIRMALLNFAEGNEPRTKLERQVYKAVPPVKRFPDFFASAAETIRCQRGVDLKPSLERSQHHLRMVKKVLAREGLPTDLAYLPHLESGYNTLAQSKVGARGIWQLMAATARSEGLRVSRYQDARTDPYMSTKAAARLLSDLKRKTGSWPLAITAYNYGPNGMIRAIKKLGSDYMTIRAKHQTKIFGFASRNYYPSFLAVRNVAMRLEKENAELPAAAVTADAGQRNAKTLALDATEASEDGPEDVNHRSSRQRLSF